MSNLNSGIKQISTSRLAFVASIAIKPAQRPISRTKPTPYSAAFASTDADLIAASASFEKIQIILKYN